MSTSQGSVDAKGNSAVSAAAKPSFPPGVAMNLFQVTGKEQAFAAGTVIYAEDKRHKATLAKGSRMYFLLSGRVAVTQNNKPLELIMPGEMFGLTALMTGSARSTTAVAQKDSVVLSLDEKQFHQALQKLPDAALMLIEVLSQRLARSSGRLAKSGNSSLPPLVSQGALDKNALEELRLELGDPPPSRMESGGTVIAHGAMAIFMYVLVEGRVAISVAGHVVEHVGPGTAFGELALVGGANRAASAVAEEASAWYSVGRRELVNIMKTKPALGVALLSSLARRVQHMGVLLTEDPAVLATMGLPRLDLSVAQGGFSLKKLMFKKTLGSFPAQAQKQLLALTAALGAGDLVAAQAGAKQLKTVADDVGAQRLAHHAQTLANACAANDFSTLEQTWPVVQAECEATKVEIQSYLAEK